MTEPVRVYIERVKAAFGVETDEDLADRIGYSKQAIANWRRRQKVPEKASVVISHLLGPEFAASDTMRFVAEHHENRVRNLSAAFFWREFWRIYHQEFPLGLENLHQRMLYINTDVALFLDSLTDYIRDERFLWKGDDEYLVAIEKHIADRPMTDLIRSVIRELPTRQ
ncbi:MAG: hypothetical protein E6Q77_07270 [Rhizobium sp.]|nr:MAG: hypothetical protein E6Q77_07270 [Rhizobium sp.]